MLPQSYLVGRDTGEDRPIPQPPRKLPLAKQVDVGETLEVMQTRGVIEESAPGRLPSSFEEQGPALLRKLQETERHEERLFPTAPGLTTLWTR
jgi:hypothetical protein